VEERVFAHVGQWVAGRISKWVTLFVWIALAVCLTMAVPPVSQEVNNNAGMLPVAAASVQAERAIKAAFPAQNGTPALLVWYRQGGLRMSDIKAIQKAAQFLADHPVTGQESVLPIEQFPVTAIASMRSKDHTTFVLPVTFAASAALSSQLPVHLQALQKELIHSLDENPFLSKILTAPGLHARITGPIGITADALGLFGHLDVTLLAATTMLVFVLLILLYRSPLLAILPLICVGIAYSIISPLLALLAKHGLIVVDAQGISIMTVLLFGAGTDYCLFMVARYREALFVQEEKHVAIRSAVTGAGGAIAMSGFTVVLALFTLWLAQTGSYHRFAVPFSLAVLIMAFAGITLVPAMLAVFGRTSFFPFIPRTLKQWQERMARRPALSHRRRVTGEPGALSRWAGSVVTRRPWTVIVLTMVVLGTLAAASFQIKTTYNLLSTFPSDMPSRQGFTLLADHFGPGGWGPVQGLVKESGQLGDLAQRIARLPYVQSAQLVKQNATATLLNVTLKSDPESNAAMQDLTPLRQAVVSDLAAAGFTHAQSAVFIAGQTATQRDSSYYNNRDTRVVIPAVIGIIALLLLVYLRSFVAMVYLLLTVLISYAAALGAGWIIVHDVLHTQAMQGAIPLYAFVFLVALGEDYNIFMISRIWQGTRELPMSKAIQSGVSRTGSVITSAGLILAGTFAVLASLPLQVLEQFGLVTAIGVLLDTFVVRPFLVPAITSVLGRWVFWPARSRLTLHDHADTSS